MLTLFGFVPKRRSVFDKGLVAMIEVGKNFFYKISRGVERMGEFYKPD